jgi:endoplasmic reticulum lectin 1
VVSYTLKAVLILLPRQYHESKDTGKQINLQEFVLGKFEQKNQKDVIRVPGEALPKIPLKKVEGHILPYFEVLMSDGTPCDLKGGQPRRASVLYVCSEGSRNEISHFEETSTCEYDIVILSPLLCKHPYYQREEPSIQAIQCFGKNGGKPKKLSALEQATKLWAKETKDKEDSITEPEAEAEAKPPSQKEPDGSVAQ